MKPRGPEWVTSVARIAGLGVAFPRRSFDNVEFLDQLGCGVRPDLERLAGIRRRYICGEEEDSMRLALAAAEECLRRSGKRPDQLGAVISCSISKYEGGLRHRFEPPLSMMIKNRIGASNALSFDLSNACAGMLTAISVLDRFIRNGTIECGMIVSGEFISSVAKNSMSGGRLGHEQLASLTVGDAGAAIIIERAPASTGDAIHYCVLRTYAEHSGLCIGQASRSGPGAVMTSKALDLHRLAIQKMTSLVATCLEVTDFALDDIDVVVPHQTSVRAIEAGRAFMQRALPGFRAAVASTVADTGNTASTSLVVALDRLLKDGRIREGQRVALLGYASGLCVGFLVFTVGPALAAHACAH